MSAGKSVADRYNVCIGAASPPVKNNNMVQNISQLQVIKLSTIKSLGGTDKAQWLSTDSTDTEEKQQVVDQIIERRSCIFRSSSVGPPGNRDFQNKVLCQFECANKMATRQKGTQVAQLQHSTRNLSKMHSLPYPSAGQKQQQDRCQHKQFLLAQQKEKELSRQRKYITTNDMKQCLERQNKNILQTMAYIEKQSTM